MNVQCRLRHSVFNLGKGFRLKLGGREFHFSCATRSPPEVYLSHGYSTSVYYLLVLQNNADYFILFYITVGGIAIRVLHDLQLA